MKHYEIRQLDAGLAARYGVEALAHGCDGEVVPHPKSGMVCTKCRVRIGLKEGHPGLAAFRADWARKGKT